jgi:hypothetical protein
VKFGSINTLGLYYTSPARSTDHTKDGTRLQNFNMHLAETKGSPWIWVLDCNGMTAKDYTDMNFTNDVFKLLSKDYDNLRNILIINPNIWIKTTVETCKKMFKSNMFDKIKYCQGSPLELFMIYENMGMPPKALKWLISIDADKPLPPLFL